MGVNYGQFNGIDHASVPLTRRFETVREDLAVWVADGSLQSLDVISGCHGFESTWRHGCRCVHKYAMYSEICGYVEGKRYSKEHIKAWREKRGARDRGSIWLLLILYLGYSAGRPAYRTLCRASRAIKFISVFVGSSSYLLGYLPPQAADWLRQTGSRFAPASLTMRRPSTPFGANSST